MKKAGRYEGVFSKNRDIENKAAQRWAVGTQKSNYPMHKGLTQL